MNTIIYWSLSASCMLNLILLIHILPRQRRLKKYWRHRFRLLEKWMDAYVKKEKE
jgi:hypothetical protein